MRVLKGIGKWFWRFMIVFSFVVNIILVIVLLVAGLLIFDIKNNIADPLVLGLHSSFVGLDDATIDTTIPVRDTIPIKLNIPLQTETTVVLTQPVPLQVNATIDLPGINAYGVAASVNLTLPAGLELPVNLDLNVPVDQQLDVALDVRAVIPLKETQLHDVASNLRLLFEPLARGLTNLPNNFGEVLPFVSDILSGNAPNLLADNAYSQNPWPGFSTTAGLNYNLFSEPVPQANQPMQTNIVPTGGIPALDEQLRPQIYAQGGPQAVNANADSNLAAQGIPPGTYNGDFTDYAAQMEASGGATSQAAGGTETGGTGGTGEAGAGSEGDLGIMPTPGAP